MHTIAKDDNCIPCLVEMASASALYHKSPFLVHSQVPRIALFQVPEEAKDAVLFNYNCMSSCTSNTNLGTGRLL